MSPRPSKVNITMEFYLIQCFLSFQNGIYENLRVGENSFLGDICYGVMIAVITETCGRAHRPHMDHVDYPTLGYISKF